MDQSSTSSLHLHQEYSSRLCVKEWIALYIASHDVLLPVLQPLIQEACADLEIRYRGFLAATHRPSVEEKRDFLKSFHVNRKGKFNVANCPLDLWKAAKDDDPSLKGCQMMKGFADRVVPSRVTAVTSFDPVTCTSILQNCSLFRFTEEERDLLSRLSCLNFAIDHQHLCMSKLTSEQFDMLFVNILDAISGTSRVLKFPETTLAALEQCRHFNFGQWPTFSNFDTLANAQLYNELSTLADRHEKLYFKSLNVGLDDIKRALRDDIDFETKSIAERCNDMHRNREAYRSLQYPERFVDVQDHVGFPDLSRIDSVSGSFDRENSFVNDSALAYLEYRQRELESCRDRLINILRGKERRFGASHSQTITSLWNLALVCGELGDHRMQAELLSRAVATVTSEYEESHPLVIASLLSLGRALGALGNHLERIEFVKHALSILQTQNSTSALVIAYDDLADSLLALGMFSDAEDAVQAAVEHALHDEFFASAYLLPSITLRVHFAGHYLTSALNANPEKCLDCLQRATARLTTGQVIMPKTSAPEFLDSVDESIKIPLMDLEDRSWIFDYLQRDSVVGISILLVKQIERILAALEPNMATSTPEFVQIFSEITILSDFVQRL